MTRKNDKAENLRKNGTLNRRPGTRPRPAVPVRPLLRSPGPGAGPLRDAAAGPPGGAVGERERAVLRRLATDLVSRRPGLRGERPRGTGSGTPGAAARPQARRHRHQGAHRGPAVHARRHHRRTRGPGAPPLRHHRASAQSRTGPEAGSKKTLNETPAPLAGPRPWTEAYERLRRSRNRPDAAAGRNGQAVLIHRGLAAWFAILEAAPPPPPRAADPGPGPELPGDVEAGLVDIIVAIAIDQLKGAAS